MTPLPPPSDPVRVELDRALEELQRADRERRDTMHRFQRSDRPRSLRAPTPARGVIAPVRR